MSLSLLPSPLLRHASSFLNDRELARVSIVSKRTEKDTLPLWKERYTRMGKTDAFFEHVPSGLNFREAYAQSWQRKHVITAFANSYLSYDNIRITNSKNVKVSLEGNFTVITFNADPQQIFHSYLFHSTQGSRCPQKLMSDAPSVCLHDRVMASYAYITDSRSPHLSALAIDVDGGMSQIMENVKRLYNEQSEGVKDKGDLQSVAKKVHKIRLDNQDKVLLVLIATLIAAIAIRVLESNYSI